MTPCGNETIYVEMIPYIYIHIIHGESMGHGGYFIYVFFRSPQVIGDFMVCKPQGEAVVS
jgi:hypothetical protein